MWRREVWQKFTDSRRNTRFHIRYEYILPKQRHDPTRLHDVTLSLVILTDLIGLKSACMLFG